MTDSRGPACRPYPLTADEAAILAAAQQRRADDVGSFLARLLRLSGLRPRPKPRPQAAPLDTPSRFR